MAHKKKLSTPLFLSTLLNVFLLGVVISCVVISPNMPNHSPPHKPSRLAQFERAKSYISPESQTIVTRIMSQQSKALHHDMKAFRNIVHEAERILLAPTLDKTALKKIHEDLDVNKAAMKTSLSDMIYQIATALPDDDRIEFFRRALPKHPRGGADFHRPPPSKIKSNSK